MLLVTLTVLAQLSIAKPLNDVDPGKNRLSLNLTVESLTFLKNFGYYAAPDPRLGRIASMDDIEGSIKKLQRFANIPETGVIDKTTVEQMQKPRCGMADFGPSDMARRKRRFTLQGSTWKKHHLTWKLTNDNNDGLTRDEVRTELSTAFGKWQAHTNMTFTEVSVGVADIMVSFIRGGHNDPFPFDGRGGTIAHAFYPHTNRGLSGDVHFDDDEIFVLGWKGGRNLLWVAVHEIGHSLGLEHSNVYEAIMYPWYKGYQGGEIELTDDDVAGIQNLYGATVATQTPDDNSRSLPSKTCISSFRAVLLDRHTQKTYVINKDKVYILGAELGIENGPIELHTQYRGLYEADAAYVREGGNAVFFKGTRYYVYEGVDRNRLVEEGSIFEKYNGLKRDVKKIDAAFVWLKNGMTYLFVGGDYYRYDERKEKVDYHYPKKISAAWRGIPNNIDAVFVWKNLVTYFFKGDQYYRLDDRTLSVVERYPKKINRAWIKCTGALVTDSQISRGSHDQINFSMMAFISTAFMARIFL